MAEAAERTALCTQIHAETDRRLDSLEKRTTASEKGMNDFERTVANLNGTVRGAVVIGTLSATIISALIGIIIKFYFGA